MRHHNISSKSWRILRYLLFPIMFILWVLFFIYNGVNDGSIHLPNNMNLRNNKSFPQPNHHLNLRESNQKKKLFPVPQPTIPFNINNAKHLIVVAGHAVLRVSNLQIADTSDSAWYLLPYQKNVGYPEIISSHIRKGIEVASSSVQESSESLLLFSGGETRKDVGPMSEGLSYYYLAKNKHWFPHEMLENNRIFTEEYARDSYENLLFSICRFKEITTHYPSRITMIGFDFKAYRFIELHRKAIGYPSQNFNYIGIHPQNKHFNHENAQKGEDAAVMEFSNDLYACKNKNLLSKKIIRNPFVRTHPYELICPELKSLMNWCGPGLYNSENLPWNEMTLKS